jgi:hypothetical protein
VRDPAVVVLAAFHVSPKTFHVGAVLRHRATAVLMRALGGVVEEEQPLLLMFYSQLPFRVVAVVRHRRPGLNRRRTPVIAHRP